MSSEGEAERARVRQLYGRAAQSETCCVTPCRSFYTAAQLARVPLGSMLGLGSGNPVGHAGLREGELVVDLGSGAGVDVFLAADRVGPKGRVIGIDMTPNMVRRARQLAVEYGIANVEFHEAVVERIPLPEGIADAVLSNCVINLSPDKAGVFREAFRILKPGGRLVVSDVVKERPLVVAGGACGCVETAMLRREYLDTIRAAGFADLEIVEERGWVWGPSGADASAVTLRAVKPGEGVTT